MRNTEPRSSMGPGLYVPVNVPVKHLAEVYALLSRKFSEDVAAASEPLFQVVQRRCSVVDRHGNRCVRKPRHSNRHSYIDRNGEWAEA